MNCSSPDEKCHGPAINRYLTRIIRKQLGYYFFSQRFWVKEPDHHSENIFAIKRYTSIVALVFKPTMSYALLCCSRFTLPSRDMLIYRRLIITPKRTIPHRLPPTSSRFVVVRDPAERLVSAFLNKCVKGGYERCVVYHR